MQERLAKAFGIKVQQLELLACYNKPQTEMFPSLS